MRMLSQMWSRSFAFASLAVFVLVVFLLPFAALAQGAIPSVGPVIGPAVDDHWFSKMVLANVLPVVITLLTPLLMAALAYLTSYLKGKSGESNAARISLLFAESANSIVAELNATLRPQLEAALADGVLTDVEKAKLKETALAALKTKLPASLMEGAKGLFGPFVDQWLAGLVERAVSAQKPAAAP